MMSSDAERQALASQTAGLAVDLRQARAEVRRLRERVDQLAGLLAAESARVAERDADLIEARHRLESIAYAVKRYGENLRADDIQPILTAPHYRHTHIESAE